MSEVLTARLQDVHTKADSVSHVSIQDEDNTSITLATYDMPHNVLNVVLPEHEISSIEYSMVTEPEYMVVFEEKNISKCKGYVQT